MTAVDHAELKRADMKPEDVLAVLRADRLPECSFDSGRTWEVDGVIVAETFTRCADLIAALLSEIEGLKAERDATEKRASEYFVAMREARGDAAVYKHDKLEAERQLADLRTQAPDSWSPDREAVARIVDGWAFDHPTVHYQHLAKRRDKALAKSDAILALRPQTAESGK